MTVLGLIAGALTTLSFLPQVIQTMRSRSAHDQSWSWLLLFAGGLASWLLYGAPTPDLPIMVTNATTLAFVVALAGLKARPVATMPSAAPAVERPATERG